MHTVNLPRTCLGCVNMVFFVISGVFFVICVWCAYNTDIFRDINYTVTKSTLVSSIANFVTLKLWVTPLTTIFIPAMTIIMLTTCCGLFGAGCKVQCALKSYIFLVSLITFFCAYIFFVSIVYNIYINNPKTMQYMTLMIYKDYGKKHDFITEMFDYLMTTFECCGSESARDFVVSYWRNQSIDKTVLYPKICCHLDSKNVPLNPNCTKSYAIKEYRRLGCFYAIQHAIYSHKKKLIFYVILAAVLYSIIVLFTLSISKGQPLLGQWALKKSTLPGKKTPSEEANESKKPVKNLEKVVVQSTTSLQNMMFAEEPPKKVVKLVSASNPSLMYQFRPSDFAYGDTSTHRSEYLTAQRSQFTHGDISQRSQYMTAVNTRTQIAPSIASQRSQGGPGILNQRSQKPPGVLRQRSENPPNIVTQRPQMPPALYPNNSNRSQGPPRRLNL